MSVIKDVSSFLTGCYVTSCFIQTQKENVIWLELAYSLY